MQKYSKTVNFICPFLLSTLFAKQYKYRLTHDCDEAQNNFFNMNLVKEAKLTLPTYAKRWKNNNKSTEWNTNNS